jgi:hypothetical protein
MSLPKNVVQGTYNSKNGIINRTTIKNGNRFSGKLTAQKKKKFEEKNKALASNIISFNRYVR